MRSVVLAGLVMLAGCEQKGPEQTRSVDLPTDVAVSVTPASAPPPTSQPIGEPPISIPVGNVAKVRHFQALGTEPFWSFEVIGDKLLYSSPEQQTALAIAAKFTNEGKRLRYSAAMDGKPVLLTIESGTCSDGMSDTVYPYKATFTWGDQTQQGCARPK